MEPKTDREILLLVSQKVDTIEEKFTDAIGRVSDSLEKLAESFEKMETTKLQKIDERLQKIEQWRLEIKGGYRVAVAIASVVGAGVGYLINYLMK